jgi:hypothetical protein
MKFNNLNGNKAEVILGNKTVLFSYKTPVAYYDSDTLKFYKTSKKWSTTTSKHIGQWLNGAFAEEIEQEKLDNLAANI